MELKHPVRVLVAAGVLGLAACSAEPVAQPAAEPAPTAQTATPAPTAASAIDGKWVSRLTREDITRQIKKAGLEEWTERFLERERVQAKNTVVYHFADGRFQVVYFEEGGVWHVGWKGPYAVAGNEVRMTDDFSGNTDVYTWRIADNRLEFDRLSSDSETLNGFPVEVYDAADIGNRWPRTDCAMEAGQDC